MIALFSCTLNDMTDTTHSTQATHKPRPLMDLLVSIIIPFTDPDEAQRRGQAGAPMARLVLALAFPLGWGSFELLKYRKFNFIALLGLVSVLLTGGIGLLKLDNQWLAIKEAAIPGHHRHRGTGIDPHPLPVDPHHAVQQNGAQRRQDP